MKSNFQDFQCGKCKEANCMYVGFELIIEAFDRKEKYQLLITTNKAQARLPLTDNLSQEIVRRQAQILPWQNYGLRVAEVNFPLLVRVYTIIWSKTANHYGNLFSNDWQLYAPTSAANRRARRLKSPEIIMWQAVTNIITQRTFISFIKKWPLV